MEKDKIENLEKELESQTNLINLKLNDLQQSWLRMQSIFGDILENIKRTKLEDCETKVVVNTKLYLDINKDTAKVASQIDYLKINLKYSEHDIESILFETKKEIILDAANLVEEQQTILRNHFERHFMQSQRSCISELETVKVKQSKIIFNYYVIKDCLTHLKIKTKSSILI